MAPNVHYIRKDSPLLYINTLWSLMWTFKLPNPIKQLAGTLVNWFPTSWHQFWYSISVSDRTSFGFWIRHRTDRVITTSMTANDFYLRLNAEFKWKPIPAGEYIRLFKIRAAPDNAPITLDDFGVYPLAEAPPFGALSYRWGSFNSSEQITIGDQSFHITPNLATALKHIRATTPNACLWCDGVCINQLDNDEKAHQIKLMRKIYGTALEVFIWLGEEVLGRYSEWGMRTLDYLINGGGPMIDPPWEVEDPTVIRLGLEAVLSKEWFRRFWTIQELALARQVTMMLGVNTIHWTDDPKLLARALQRVKWAEISPQWDANEMPDMKDILDLLYMQRIRDTPDIDSSYPVPRRVSDEDTAAPPKRGSILLDVIHRFKKNKRESFDPRDQIFALLGMVPAEELRGFEPSYDRTLEDMYADLYSRIEIRDEDDLNPIMKLGSDDDTWRDAGRWNERWNTAKCRECGVYSLAYKRPNWALHLGLE